MKKFIFTIFASMLLFSCSEDKLDTATSKAKSLSDLEFSQRDRFREKFARALVTALHDNEDLRKFIKDEALKMFNKDYDVLYHMVKNKPLNGQYLRNSTMVSYSTFRELLLTYFENESDLIEIENQLPLLTVFVPKLPENSFSAENWDPADPNQYPAVAFSMDLEEDVPIIFHNHEDIVLEKEYTPGFPVVVIKDNERMVSNQEEVFEYYRNSTTDILVASGGLQYVFIGDNLNPNITPSNPNFVNTTNSQPINHTSTWNFIEGRDLTVAPILVNAHQTFANSGIANPWQRDFIYHGITPTNPNGPLTYNYKEAITYIQLTGGTPTFLFNMISQRNLPGNNDPGLNSLTSGNRSPWTDGFFEFMVEFIHNSDGSIPIVASLPLNVAPEDLFVIQRTRVFRWFGGLFRNTIVGTKAIDFYPNGFNGMHLYLPTWDLGEFGNRWEFKFYEKDNLVERSDSRTWAKKHNANIAFDIAGGGKTKVGIKFGGSTELTNSRTVTYKWTEGQNNILGTTWIEFGDNTVNRHPTNNKYYPNLFNAQNISFELRPVQTQF